MQRDHQTDDRTLSQSQRSTYFRKRPKLLKTYIALFPNALRADTGSRRLAYMISLCKAKSTLYEIDNSALTLMIDIPQSVFFGKAIARTAGEGKSDGFQFMKVSSSVDHLSTVDNEVREDTSSP